MADESTDVQVDEPEDDTPEPEEIDTGDDATMIEAIGGYLSNIVPYVLAVEGDAWKGEPLDDIEMKALRGSIVSAASRATRIFRNDLEAA